MEDSRAPVIRLIRSLPDGESVRSFTDVTLALDQLAEWLTDLDGPGTDTSTTDMA